MLWILYNSHWLIAMLGVMHLCLLGLLYVWRSSHIREMRAFLANLVRGFSSRGDVGLLDIDDEIESFITDIHQVLENPDRERDRAELSKRMEIKDEARPYLRSIRPEVIYNVARTGIEIYPHLGILFTILAMGLVLQLDEKSAAAPAGPPLLSAASAPPMAAAPHRANQSSAAKIVRAFGAAIWSTVAGLAAYLVLLLVNAVISPSLDRVVEHRARVREVVFAARKQLGLNLAAATAARLPPTRPIPEPGESVEAADRGHGAAT